MLLFGKFQSPLTSGAIWYIRGFPCPVGKFTNTSLPLRNSATAFSCCGLRFWTPNVEHTPETVLTLVALASDFLLPPSVNARSLSNYSRWANKLTRQPIRTTTGFSGSDVTGQHYRPVPSLSREEETAEIQAIVFPREIRNIFSNKLLRQFAQKLSFSCPISLDSGHFVFHNLGFSADQYRQVLSVTVTADWV